jgi:hypothetical protein
MTEKKPNPLTKFMQYYRAFQLIAGLISGLAITALWIMGLVSWDVVWKALVLLATFGFLDPKIDIIAFIQHISTFRKDGNGEA